MEEVVTPTPTTSRRKQLLFDRRYGWVYEEWTDPVEVANIGGRGMFSLVPLTAATIDGTLHLANLAADAVAKTVRSHQLPDWLFRSNGTVDREMNCQVETSDIRVEKSASPTFVKFPRRIRFDEITEE